MFNAVGLNSIFLHVQDQRWFYALLSVTGLFYLITFICICLSYRHQRSPCSPPFPHSLLISLFCLGITLTTFRFTNIRNNCTESESDLFDIKSVSLLQIFLQNGSVRIDYLHVVSVKKNGNG
jgi:hypothetical protein